MPDITQTVDTIAILMLENRSFDHVLGYLSLPFYAQGRNPVEGLPAAPGDMSDYTGPLAELTGWLPNDDIGGNVYSPFHLSDGPLPADLPHGRELVGIQVSQNAAGKFLMNGFVRSYHAYAQVRNVHPEPMGFFTPKEVPMMDFLAREYAICDHWHCPLPTDTQPNRLMSLTGYTDRDDTPLRPFPDELPMVLDWLTNKGVPWRVYSEDISFFAFFNKWRTKILLGPEDDEFRSTARLKDDFNDMATPFPNVIFIEPSFDDAPLIHDKPNCDHPPLPIGYGQELLSRIYSDLTSNAARWAKTVLLITYDEHGGFQDHVPPLPVGAEYPEDLMQQVATYNPLLTTGPRVPGIVVSPLVAKGAVYSRNLDHTCMLQFLADRFDNQMPYSGVVAKRANQGHYGRIADILTLGVNDRAVVPGPQLQRPTFGVPLPQRQKRVGLYEMARVPNAGMPAAPPAPLAAAPRRARSVDGGSRSRATTTLKRSDTGDFVKAVQRDLNKLGSLLVVDGDFGPTTEAAVVDARVALGKPGPPEVDDDFQAVLARVDDPSPDLTAPGVSFIGREEVSGPAEYRKKYSHPIWPTKKSGITIGIGYDLRAVSKAKLASDWVSFVTQDALDRLALLVGVAGTATRLESVSDVEILLPFAISVFLKRMIPEHVKNTRTAYPMLDILPSARRTALISLVFNRGSDLKGDRRREMKAIRDLLEAGKPEEVADQFDAMERLWDPATEGGVIKRRHREATLWRSGFSALQLA